MMPLFHFVAVVDGEVAEAEGGGEFCTLDAARAAARDALGRIAAQRLTKGECEFISVEIFNAAKTPLTEIRIEVREIPK
jgi:hypothetical protein